MMPIDKQKLKSLQISMPRFTELETPFGFLDHERESHALWYYYTIARNAYETHIKDVVIYEDMKDPETNFNQMFSSVAAGYGVTPEAMGQCWPQIDMQARALGLPLLPHEETYRFSRKSEMQ